MDAPVPEGTLIGNRWRVVGQLGEGGFGRVFEAVDESDISLGRAAVKLLHPNISPLERNSFLAEVQRIAGLRHPNLVGYLDSGQQTVNDEIHPYLVTELCVGTLDDHVRAKPGTKLPAAEALAVLTDVSAGLDHLHQRSLIHRDIKPGNVLYADGNWKLADFGLMRDLTATGTYHRSSQLTGTPMFMAPELFSTMTATAPSDIYALGVLAHLISSGRPVHRGSGPALVHQITTGQPEIDETLFPALRDLIARATAVEPGHRPTAKEFHEIAVAHRAEAAAATRAIETYPPPSVGPAAEVPPGHEIPPVAHPGRPGATSATSAPHTVPTPDRVSGAMAPETGARYTTVAPDHATVADRTQAVGPTVADDPSGAVASYRTTPQVATPVPGAEHQTTSVGGDGGATGGRGPLLAALVVTTIVAVGALAALVFIVLGDDTEPTPGPTDAAGDTPATDSGGDGTDAALDGEEVDGGTDLDATPSVQSGAVADSAGGPIDLSSPVTIDGGISVALDRQVYTFDGAAGEQVSAEVQLLNGECSSSNRWDLEISVLDPSGQVIDEVIDNPNCRDAYGPWVLPVDGQYSFVAAGAQGTSSRPATGTFQITVGKLLVVDTPVDLSSPVTIDGGVVIARDRQLFTFDAVAGQRISVQILALNGECSSANRWDMEVFVLDADGTVIGEVEDNLNCGDALGPWELPSAGQHSLAVAGGDGSQSRPATGTFQLTLATLQG